MIRSVAPPSVVLCYHAVAPLPAGADDRLCIVTPEDLAAHVGHLRERGYELVSAGRIAEQLAADGAPEPGLAALTFDDGWRSDLLTTAPLLARLEVPATFFLCPGLFGNRDPAMGEAGAILTAAEVPALAATGAELGAHTMTHPDMRAVGATQRARELEDSRREVARLAGRPCSLLAWPSGWSDAAAQDAAREAGFTAAFAALPGPWRRFAAPRLGAPVRGGAAVLGRWLDRYVGAVTAAG
jgi:peptidoglycan/xylan/chitin deacetylase (PgdA/CDA1 family)